MELKIIGHGSFANVYYQPSTNKVIKQLKDNLTRDRSQVSRFKREFEITKSLNNIESVIRVYNYNEQKFEYTMEKADFTLSEFIEQNSYIDIKEKYNYVIDIIETINKIHSFGVIHRDISPTNIYLKDNKIKIGDFGIGKNLNQDHSFQTMNTQGIGQYYYCAPEQHRELKEGSKLSDIFSLGRVINFIMTGKYNDVKHELRQVSEKATNEEPNRRYTDTQIMLNDIQLTIKFNNDKNNIDNIFKDIQNRNLTKEVKNYLSQLNGKKLYKLLYENKTNFKFILIKYMKENLKYSEDIIVDYHDYFENSGEIKFENIDLNANFLQLILKENNFNFTTKEYSANILYSMANVYGRYHAQDIVKSIIKDGVEPLIENILKGE